MNASHTRTEALWAEPSLAGLLRQLDGTEAEPEGSYQRRANRLLASIAWSRLAEPGDGTAGALLSVLGPEGALELLVRGARGKVLQQLLETAGVDISVRAAGEALKRWVPRLDRSATIKDIEQAVAAGLRVVLPGDDGWPTNLSDLEFHAPNLLWVRGKIEYLSTPSLGVVGARAATGYGTHITAEIVDGVCAAGFTIVSGAAYGIDAVAHRTALAAGAPTVAVVAGGADRPYPRAHESLLNRISQAGAVCSEMIPAAAPTRWRFLQRNRLIAALSIATLVTEAGIRSGSLNTAGHATQLSRAVGAVPGPVTSAASAGCHRLVREYGAALITGVDDACELLGLTPDAQWRVDGGEEGQGRAWQKRVLDALPLRGSLEAPEIAREAGLTSEQTDGVLAELELLGQVQRRVSQGSEGARWQLRK